MKVLITRDYFDGTQNTVEKEVFTFSSIEKLTSQFFEDRNLMSVSMTKVVPMKFMNNMTKRLM